MIRSILVGLDGSPHSLAATELGIEWAREFDSLLVGLGVIDERSIRKPQSAPIGGGSFKGDRDNAMITAAHRIVEQILSRFSLHCAEAQVPSKVLEYDGCPAEKICLESQRYDLVLLGQRTYFLNGEQGLPDDTVVRVLKNSPRPVVTVPEQLKEGSSVVIAYDGSMQSARSLQMFLNLGLDVSRPVHVVSVHAKREEAVRHAERAIEFLGFHGIAAQRHALVSTSPAASILEQVDEHQARLLVMGAYGNSGLREIFLGSVTQSLLKDSEVPVLLYH